MSKQTEALKLALKKAFDLGQRYWQQADSDFTSQWRKADVTLASFNQLVEDTIREALAEQPVQQQEPVAWKLMPRKATDEMLKAMDECSTEGYDERLYAGHASSVYMAAWDSLPEVKHELNCVCGAIWEGDELVCTPHPPAQRKPLTDEQIMEMYNEPRSDAEMIAFARAIEAAHGIKEQQ